MLMKVIFMQWEYEWIIEPVLHEQLEESEIVHTIQSSIEDNKP